MLNLALLFLVIALLAAILGFGGLVGSLAAIAQATFVFSLVLFLVTLIMGACLEAGRHDV